MDKSIPLESLFLRELSRHLFHWIKFQEDNKEGIDLIKEIAKGLITLSTTLASVPFVDKIINIGLDQAFTYKEKSVEEQVKMISNKLQRLKTPIFIFVDDVERCMPSEVEAILKLTRGVGSFTNIIYVMGFNKEILAEAISGNDPYKGYHFLEKIFDWEEKISLQPALAISKEWVNEGNLFIYNKYALPQLVELETSYRECLKIVEEVKKYADPIPRIDLLLLETIRIKRPDIFALLEKYKGQIVGSTTEGSLEWFKEAPSTVKMALSYLFPSLSDSSIEKIESHIPESSLRPKYLNTPIIFDLYQARATVNKEQIENSWVLREMLTFKQSQISNNQIETTINWFSTVEETKKQELIRKSILLNPEESSPEAVYTEILCPITKKLTEVYASLLEQPSEFQKSWENIEIFLDGIIKVFFYAETRSSERLESEKKKLLNLMRAQDPSELLLLEKMILQNSFTPSHHRAMRPGYQWFSPFKTLCSPYDDAVQFTEWATLYSRVTETKESKSIKLRSPKTTIEETDIEKLVLDQINILFNDLFQVKKQATLRFVLDGKPEVTEEIVIEETELTKISLAIKNRVQSFGKKHGTDQKHSTLSLAIKSLASGKTLYSYSENNYSELTLESLADDFQGWLLNYYNLFAFYKRKPFVVPSPRPSIKNGLEWPSLEFLINNSSNFSKVTLIPQFALYPKDGWGDLITSWRTAILALQSAPKDSILFSMIDIRTLPEITDLLSSTYNFRDGNHLYDAQEFWEDLKKEQESLKKNPAAYQTFNYLLFSEDDRLEDLIEMFKIQEREF